MLRDYQIDICSRVREAFVQHRSVMVQMPTGTGKTVVLTSFLNEELRMKNEEWENEELGNEELRMKNEEWENEELRIKNEELRIKNEEVGGARVLIVAHRRELIEQIKATIKRMGVDDRSVVVESIQTISRRLAQHRAGETLTLPVWNFSLIVIDEAHHALAKTYRLLWEAWPEAKFLGLTATPCRLNGSGFTDLFDVLLCSLSVPEFIRKGVLASFDYVSINEGSCQQRLIDSLKKRGADGDYQVKEMNEVLNRSVSIEKLYDCYASFAKGKKGIVYAVSIEHAHNIAEYYERKGIRAVAISAKTPAKERAALLEQFREGKVQMLVNVDIFSEGFDCPDVEFIQLARPTLSLAKYLQMVGRGLRPHKDKDYCVILDNVGLVRLFGLPTRCWNWHSAFEGRLNVIKGLKNERIKGQHVSLPMNIASSPLTPEQPSEYSLVVGHEQLEELIRYSELEEWNERNGIVEEETESFRDESCRLWGLKRGGKVVVEPSFLRVFNIKDGLAAVRLKDMRLAVIDMSGTLVRTLGKGLSARVCNKDFVEVVRQNDNDYIDLLNGQVYFELPEIVSTKEPRVICTKSDGKVLRLKDQFIYGAIKDIDEYEYFYMIYTSRYRGDVDNYAVDTDTLIVLKGDDERAYWLYDVQDDGSIDVIDRSGNCYRVMRDGRKEKLNRCFVLESSLTLLKEIANQYKKEGRESDRLSEWKYRNAVLYRRISGKLEGMRKR
ncbi:MAG: DEAD/DEAH box helicase [Prevotella sp.]